MIANLRDEIDWYNVRSMVTKCAERAHEEGHQYFGIQFYGECWVDKEGAARYHMHGKAESKKCYEGKVIFYNTRFNMKMEGELNFM